MADVIIVVDDINDNAPTFHKTAYDVVITDDVDMAGNYEVNDEDDVILTLFAYDPDEGRNGHVTYWISGECENYTVG